MSRDLLVEGLKKAVDKRVEIPIPLASIIDLTNRVDDRGVMLSSKAAADLRKRCVGQ